MVENELKLTPTERKNVEKYWVTPANFVLNEKIAWLSNADKVIALQDISSDAYNNVTNIFKNVIPQDYRTESKTAWKMLQTMIETMEKSDIVKEEYADYIAKLKEMKNYQTFSPYEKLAIRRDFDAIVWNDIFWANGRVKWLEDQTIAKWRADLNEEINQLWEEFGIDVKNENSRIANAITIRDWLLRALSQNKKNNAIWLQDLWIWAILSAWNPVQAGGIIIAKRLLENAAWNIAQGIYNMNDAPLERANTKRGAWFIQKSNPDANNNFMISPVSSDISTNTQEELDVWTSPLDTIPDRNVWVNPTDTVISENINETAWNQAQGLYNQGDENLSPNSEQMTKTNPSNNLNSILLNDLNGMKEGDQIHIEFSEGDGETITRVGDSYRTEYDSSDSDYSYQFIKQDELSKHLDNMEEAFGIEDYEYVDNVSKNKSSNMDFSELSIDELKSRIDDERDPLWWTSDLWLDLDAEWRRRTDYYSNNPDELVKLVDEWVNSIAMKDFVQEATLKMLLQDNISAEVEKIGGDILKKLGATKTLNQEVTTTPKKKTTKKKTSKKGLNNNQVSSKTADSTNNNITKDSEWNTLSKEDQEKFGNSKIVDGEWNLLVVMHGSPSQEVHDHYDETKAWGNVHADSKWVYFTDNLDLAEQFAHEQLPWSSAFRTVLWKRGHLYKSYVNITNPLNLNTATPEQLLPFFREDVLTKTWDEEKRLDNLRGHPQFVKFHVDMDKVEKAWYDGIIAAIGKEWEWNEYIVFKGSQAKNIWEIKES